MLFKKQVYQIKTDPFSSHQQISQFIIKHLPPKLKLIDLGCDIGFLGILLRKLRKHSYTIHGVDINKKNLYHAKENYQQTFCFDLNQKKWPLKQRYDVVVLADTLEHLVYPMQVITKAISLLKPGGILIISIPNITFLWARLKITLGDFPQDNRGIFDKTHLHFYTLNTFSKFIHSFSSLKQIAYLSTTPPLQFIINAPTYILTVLFHLAYALTLIRASLFSYQHIFILVKR